MSDSLPKVKDVIEVGGDEEYEREEVMVVAVDLEECLWTCVTKEGELRLYMFDENSNFFQIEVDAEWSD